MFSGQMHCFVCMGFTPDCLCVGERVVVMTYTCVTY